MNCKKRKLKYIREKNYYRKGGVATSWFKVSSGMTDVISQETETQSERAIENLKRKYKMDFEVSEIKNGTDGNDFDKGLKTVMFTLKVFNK